MELTLNPEHMAVDPGAKAGIGASVLAGALWLVKRLRDDGKSDAKNELKEDQPSVRTWKDGQSRIEALLRGIEAQLTEANLPELRRTAMMQGTKINNIEAGQMRMQDELVEFRREMRKEIEELRSEDGTRDQKLKFLSERLKHLEEE